MRGKDPYLDFLLDWLSPLGEITSRAMFGGHCLYCDGIVFALIADKTLYLKVDDATRPRFESAGQSPFRPYVDKPEVMQYYTPPAEFFEDSGAMKSWAGDAVAAGRRARKKPKPGRRLH